MTVNVHFSPCLPILILSKLIHSCFRVLLCLFSSFFVKQKKIASCKAISKLLLWKGFCTSALLEKYLETLPPPASCCVMNFNRMEKQVALLKLQIKRPCILH